MGGGETVSQSSSNRKGQCRRAKAGRLLWIWLCERVEKRSEVNQNMQSQKADSQA